MSERLQEYCHSAQAEMRVDVEKAVIRGVKILGLRSRNGRIYTEDALRRAARLYEGAKVNVNHPRFGPTAPRDYQERLGVVRRVRFRAGEGLYGDLHYNPNHPVAEQLVWDAQHAPENVGLSHHVVALTRREGDTLVVEAIHRVESVDLVADPATTSGLFETRKPDVSKPMSLGRDASRLDGENSCGGSVASCSAYGNDTGATRSCGNGTQNDLSEEVAIAGRAADTGELAMLTVEKLRRERPDLVEAILVEQAMVPHVGGAAREGISPAPVDRSTGSLLAAVDRDDTARAVPTRQVSETLPSRDSKTRESGSSAAPAVVCEEHRRLALEVDRLRAERALLRRRCRVRQLLMEHGLPDPELAQGGQRELVSEWFVEHLLSLPDESSMRRAVEERARLARAAWCLRPQCRDQLLIEGRSRPRDVGQFVSAITG